MFFMGERMSTKDAPVQCYNAIWGQFWGHGPLENLLEIGLSIITCIPIRQLKSIQMLLIKRQDLTLGGGGGGGTAKYVLYGYVPR